MLNTIVLVIPVLLLIVFAEWYIGYKNNRGTYTTGNFVMNLAIGAMDQVCSLIYFAALYVALEFVYSHFRLFTLHDHWYHWITAYVVVDFLSYWYHRFSHRINILWAGHVTHHSSEHFNLSNGFRTSFFQGINRIIFWSCLPLFGFSPLMLVIILKVSGLYDFLLHTQYIPKLGFLEKILITPSQHRVHHGRNDIYIDKNYGSTFVIWDKLFGTYQEETETVEYGIKGPYVDNNPFMAVGYYYRYLWHAMKMQKGLRGKINLLFLPPDRTPNPYRETQYTVREHIHHAPSQLRQYAWFQIGCAIPGMILMLLFKEYLSAWEIVICSAVGISSVAGGARILNGNIREQFSVFESVRLALALFVFVSILVIQLKMYTIPVAMFLVFSLMFLAILQERKSTDVSRQKRWR
ncbi:MAG TPA: sterol desaturase family protein [Bacteroidia bacterium]|nr:sterol desaturase family protein [Bacteroidia bacterium]